MRINWIMQKQARYIAVAVALFFGLSCGTDSEANVEIKAFLMMEKNLIAKSELMRIRLEEDLAHLAQRDVEYSSALYLESTRYARRIYNLTLEFSKFVKATTDSLHRFANGHYDHSAADFCRPRLAAWAKAYEDYQDSMLAFDPLQFWDSHYTPPKNKFKHLRDTVDFSAAIWEQDNIAAAILRLRLFDIKVDMFAAKTMQIIYQYISNRHHIGEPNDLTMIFSNGQILSIGDSTTIEATILKNYKYQIPTVATFWLDGQPMHHAHNTGYASFVGRDTGRQAYTVRATWLEPLSGDTLTATETFYYYVTPKKPTKNAE
jgi:hypothetical protein